MTEGIDPALEEEAEDDVVNTAKTDETTGQGDEAKPADPPKNGAEPEKVSPSKARRERRKAATKRFREQEAEKAREVEAANQKLKKIEEDDRGAKPPVESDFDDFNEYEAARLAYAADTAVRRADKARTSEAVSNAQAEVDAIRGQAQAEIQENWTSQALEARTRYKDFDQVVNDPGLSITEGMAQMLSASDVGADVAYHLGMNKEVAAQIAALSPIEQAMAIGRLESTVTIPEPNRRTNAPDPIDPVRGKASAAADPTDMSPDEYRKWRQAGGTF